MIIVGLVALLMGVVFMGIGLNTGIWVVTFSISGACLLYALIKYASRNSGISDGYKGEIRLPSEEHVTRDGFHVAVGKEKPLDPDFSPSHILKE